MGVCRQISLTLAEAEALIVECDKTLKTAAAVIVSIKRRRSWSDSQRATAQVPYLQTLQRIQMLKDRIESAFKVADTTP